MEEEMKAKGKEEENKEVKEVEEMYFHVLVKYLEGVQ